VLGRGGEDKEGRVVLIFKNSAPSPLKKKNVLGRSDKTLVAGTAMFLHWV